jgi:phosphatidylethanolamine-binding protein (PEBP) family uncharacterized protein
MVLRSPSVADGGQIPVEFTGDGAAATLPLEWSGAPLGTKSFRAETFQGARCSGAEAALS